MAPTLPPPAAVSKILQDLLGRDVQLATAARALAEAAAVGVYVSPDGQVVGLWGWDLSGAASAAAALSLVPPGVASEAVKAKALPPMLSENLHEVMNVGARVFSSATHRASLRDVEVGAAGAAAVKAVAFAARVDFDVRIAGYAPGRMFVAFAPGA